MHLNKQCIYYMNRILHVYNKDKVKISGFKKRSNAYKQDMIIKF